MNTRKDFERAAEIVKDFYLSADPVGRDDNGQYVVDARVAVAVESAFVSFFRGDNPQFDKEKFLAACKPQKKGKR